MTDDVLLDVRALVLRDLSSRGFDSAAAVDILEDVLAERRWWVEQWPEGAAFVAGQVAQDVQDKLLDAQLGRWPRCTVCDHTDLHELRITPELGSDPRWTCEKSGVDAGPLGSL